jgi:hypothetical protein
MTLFQKLAVALDLGVEFGGGEGGPGSAGAPLWRICTVQVYKTQKNHVQTNPKKTLVRIVRFKKLRNRFQATYSASQVAWRAGRTNGVLVPALQAT